MPKVCTMAGVRGGERDYDVELWLDDESGRYVIRAFNEAGYSYTDIDLLDLIGWLDHAQSAQDPRIPSWNDT